LECSALDNEGVRAVFHSALRWALQRWETAVDNSTVVRDYLKQPLGILNILEQPQQLIIFKQMIRTEDEETLTYIENNIDVLVDIIISDEYAVQFSSSVCDLFTNHIKLLAKLVNKEMLNKIFHGLGEDFQERRRGTLLLRLLNFLFVNQRNAVIEFIQENQILSLLVQNLNENTIDFITNTLDILKQLKMKDPTLEIDLLNVYIYMLNSRVRN